jgi:hypothetical protein
MSERTATQLEKWILQKLASLAVDGSGRPVLACQVTLVTGENFSGALRAAEVSGVFEMLVEAQRGNGERIAVDRILPAETILSIMIPRDLPPIERTANTGSRIFVPGG